MEEHPTPVPLADEDRARMRRLYEEIAGRLEEMHFIIARTADIKAQTIGRTEGDTKRVTFTRESMVGAPPGEPQPYQHIVVCVEDKDGCGCYEDPPGVCRPCGPGD